MSVMIVDDLIQEDTESFFVTLQMTSDQRIGLIPDEAEINIIGNDDGLCNCFKTQMHGRCLSIIIYSRNTSQVFTKYIPACVKIYDNNSAMYNIHLYDELKGLLLVCRS